ncbi:MAG TPA: histidine phosphatase family protein [Mycobacteriales bacterium]|nr:histidine phosphatase family protein [Mycobacteriales bacterium]
MTGRRLVVWRHGRTAWNAERRFQGQLDPPLDPVGARQAAAAAGLLASLGPDLLLSSDLTRARSTAAALAELVGLPVGHDPRLREIDLGGWQGLTAAEAAQRFPGEYRAWVDHEDRPRGGGETYLHVADRAEELIGERLAAVPAGGVLVAVTHGGTARALLGRLLELEPGRWWRLGPLGNASWSILTETGQGWRLVEHNAATPPTDALGDDAEPAVATPVAGSDPGGLARSGM